MTETSAIAALTTAVATALRFLGRAGLGAAPRGTRCAGLAPVEAALACLYCASFDDE